MTYEPPPAPPPGGYGGSGVPGGGYPGGGGSSPGGYGGYPPPSQPPQNYLVWAILTTLFCCLPFGIAAIVFATQVNSKWAMGDVNGAMDASRRARTFSIVSAALGVAGIALGAILFVFLVANSTTTSTS
jgi:hypothetical protein